MSRYVIGFEALRRADVALVGGKNSSLGEMVQELAGQGIAVPGGFATTADAYRAFIAENDLGATVSETIARWQAHKITLAEAGRAIRAAIVAGDWPDEIRENILAAYRDLSAAAGKPDLAVAVRSSATAEDLPDASFAGQQETFLNISGEADLLAACRRCFASLFTDRAISYREVRGFDHSCAWRWPLPTAAVTPCSPALLPPLSNCCIVPPWSTTTCPALTMPASAAANPRCTRPLANSWRCSPATR